MSSFVKTILLAIVPSTTVTSVPLTKTAPREQNQCSFTLGDDLFDVKVERKTSSKKKKNNKLKKSVDETLGEDIDPSSSSSSLSVSCFKEHNESNKSLTNISMVPTQTVLTKSSRTKMTLSSHSATTAIALTTKNSVKHSCVARNTQKKERSAIQNLKKQLLNRSFQAMIDTNPNDALMELCRTGMNSQNTALIHQGNTTMNRTVRNSNPTSSVSTTIKRGCTKRTNSWSERKNTSLMGSDSMLFSSKSSNYRSKSMGSVTIEYDKGCSIVSNEDTTLLSLAVYEILVHLFETNKICLSAVHYCDILGNTPLHLICSNPVLASNFKLIKLFVEISDFLSQQHQLEQEQKEVSIGILQHSKVNLLQNESSSSRSSTLSEANISHVATSKNNKKSKPNRCSYIRGGGRHGTSSAGFHRSKMEKNYIMNPSIADLINRSSTSAAIPKTAPIVRHRATVTPSTIIKPTNNSHNKKEWNDENVDKRPKRNERFIDGIISCISTKESSSDSNYTNVSETASNISRIGGTTLHRVCQQLYNTTSDIVEYLIRCNPAAVCVQDQISNGNLPIHEACIACTKKRKFKNSSASNSNNDSRQVGSCTTMSDPLEIMILLLQEWPDSCKAPNNDGDLPLHLAVRIDHFAVITATSKPLEQEGNYDFYDDVSNSLNNSMWLESTSFEKDYDNFYDDEEMEYQSNRMITEIEAFASLNGSSFMDVLSSIEVLPSDTNLSPQSKTTSNIENDAHTIGDMSSCNSSSKIIHGNSNNSQSVAMPGRATSLRRLPKLVTDSKKVQTSQSSTISRRHVMTNSNNINKCPSSYNKRQEAFHSSTKLGKSLTFFGNDNDESKESLYRRQRSRSVQDFLLTMGKATAKKEPGCALNRGSSHNRNSNHAATASLNSQLSYCTLQLDIIKYLVEYYPEALHVPNRNGHTPIQIAFVTAMTSLKRRGSGSVDMTQMYGVSSTTSDGSRKITTKNRQHHTFASQHPIVEFLRSCMTNNRTSEIRSSSSSLPLPDSTLELPSLERCISDVTIPSLLSDPQSTIEQYGNESCHSPTSDPSRYFQLKQLPSSPTILTLELFDSKTNDKIEGTSDAGDNIGSTCPDDKSQECRQNDITKIAAEDKENRFISIPSTIYCSANDPTLHTHNRRSVLLPKFDKVLDDSLENESFMSFDLDQLSFISCSESNSFHIETCDENNHESINDSQQLQHRIGSCGGSVGSGMKTVTITSTPMHTSSYNIGKDRSTPTWNSHDDETTHAIAGKESNTSRNYIRPLCKEQECKDSEIFPQHCNRGIPSKAYQVKTPFIMDKDYTSATSTTNTNLVTTIRADTTTISMETIESFHQIDTLQEKLNNVKEDEQTIWNSGTSLYFNNGTFVVECAGGSHDETAAIWKKKKKRLPSVILKPIRNELVRTNSVRLDL